MKITEKEVKPSVHRLSYFQISPGECFRNPDKTLSKSIQDRAIYMKLSNGDCVNLSDGDITRNPFGTFALVTPELQVSDKIAPQMS